MENNGAKKIGFGWFILSFFIPLVGIILYFTWRNDETKLDVRGRTLTPAIVSIVLGVFNYLRILGSM